MSAHASSSTHSGDQPTSALDLSNTKTSVACRSCRTRRIKCIPGPQTSFSLNPDAPRPCAGCTASGKSEECVYPPSKDRAAFSRQYVQNLEARVQALENTCKRLEQDVQHKIGSIQPAGSISHEARPRTQLDPGVLVPDNIGYPRWTGIRNAYTPLDTLMSASISSPSLPSGLSNYISYTNTKRNSAYFGAPSPADFMLPFLPKLESLPFPDQATAEALVDAYYEDIDCLIPITPSHRIREFVADLCSLENRGGDIEELGGIYSLLYAVFALGERVRETRAARKRDEDAHLGIWHATPPVTDQPNNQSSQVWADISYYLFYATSKHFTHLKAQCSILLSIYYAGVSQLPRAWALAGQASRHAQECGDHRNYSCRMSGFQFKQVGRRDWWAIYCIDRFLSMTLGRNYAIEDEDTDAPFPLAISDRQIEILDEQDIDEPHPGQIEEPADCSVSGFLAMVKLSTIAGKISKCARRRKKAVDGAAAADTEDIAMLEEDLEEWYEHEVAIKYKAAMEGDVLIVPRSIRLMAQALHHTYYSVSIALHEALGAFHTDASKGSAPPMSITPKCVAMSRKLIQSTFAHTSICPPPTPLLAVQSQYVWSAGMILLAHHRCSIATQNPSTSAALSLDIEACRQVLRAQVSSYPTAATLIELLNAAESREQAIDDCRENGDHRPQKRQRRMLPHEMNGAASLSTPGAGQEGTNDLRAAKNSFIRAFHNRRLAAARKETHAEQQTPDPFHEFFTNSANNGLDVDAFFQLFGDRDAQGLSSMNGLIP